MSSRGRLFLIGAILLLLGQIGPAQEALPAPGKAAMLDRYGDPLPTGARARMGTIRFRHGGPVHFLTFSPDGKRLVSAGEDQAVRVWDAATGKELHRFRGGTAEQLVVAVSPDGKALVLVEDGQYLRFLDVTTGRELRRLTPRIAMTAAAFAPDGNSLALISQDSAIHLCDWATPAAGGKFRTFVSFQPQQGGQPAFAPALLAFSPDGTSLAVAGAEGNVLGQVRRYDVATGRELRRLTGFTAAIVALTFAPDGKTAAVLDGTQQIVRLFDLATGKEVRQLNFAQGGARSLAFAPDGKLLAVVNGSEVSLWDPASGKEVRKLASAASALCLAFSPNGKLLAAGSADNRILLWDVASGKEVVRDGGHLAPVTSVALTPDGRMLASVGADHTIRLWDTATGRELGRLARPSIPEELGVPGLLITAGIAFAPDGKMLAACYPDGSLILWDPATGKEHRRIEAHPAGIVSVAYAPAGNVVATAGGVGMIRLWDPATGKRLREIKSVALPEGQPLMGPSLAPLAFSPDGRILAGCGIDITGAPEEGMPTTIHLWEVSTGQVRRRFQVSSPPPMPGLGALGFGGGVGLGFGGGIAGFVGGQGFMSTLAFAPGGRHLAFGTEDTIHLWDVARGREVRRFGGRCVLAHTFAFSPDGKLLVAGTQGGAIQFWDAATGTALADFAGHRGPVTATAFSANGNLLTTAGMDTTVLAWDVPFLVTALQAAPPRLTRAQLESCWKDLAGADAAKAFDAIGTLASDPGPAVALLRARLRPVSRPDQAKIERLIAALNDDRFEVRKRAAEDLARLGELAEPALRKARAGRPSLEVRRRIDDLLSQIEGPVADADQLRVLRSIEALERIGTADARQLLETLAAGAPESRLTRDARRALERLAREATPRP
jgi:WD40 repeat protein